MALGNEQTREPDGSGSQMAFATGPAESVLAQARRNNFDHTTPHHHTGTGKTYFVVSNKKTAPSSLVRPEVLALNAQFQRRSSPVTFARLGHRWRQLRPDWAAPLQLCLAEDILEGAGGWTDCCRLSHAREIRIFSTSLFSPVPVHKRGLAAQCFLSQKRQKALEVTMTSKRRQVASVHMDPQCGWCRGRCTETSCVQRNDGNDGFSEQQLRDFTSVEVKRRRWVLHDPGMSRRCGDWILMSADFMASFASENSEIVWYTTAGKFFARRPTAPRRQSNSRSEVNEKSSKDTPAFHVRSPCRARASMTLPRCSRRGSKNQAASLPEPP